MTRIDFYQIESDEDPLFFTCRLIEKVYRRGHRIYVHTGDEAGARAMDDLLWSFRPDRFIPHEVASGTEDESRAPIRIGHDHEPVSDLDVLVTLVRFR